MQVKNNMTHDVYTTSVNTALNEVWDFMETLGIRHMPVLDDNRLVGIISDRDVLIRATIVNGKIIVPDVLVREAMTKHVITCHSRSQIGQVASLMLDNKIDCLPVIDGGLLVGLITSSDMLEILSTAASGAAHQVIPMTFQIRNTARFGLSSSANI
jgi:acetoin utilization protein AcuB